MGEKFCPWCGQSNDESFRFCQKCGRALVPASPGVAETPAAPRSSSSPQPPWPSTAAAPPVAAQAAAPVTPREPSRRKSHLAIVLVLIALLVVAAVVILVLTGALFETSGKGNPAVTITVTGITLTPSYTGTTDDYFSTVSCLNCPFQENGGADFQFTFTETSSALIFDHNINDVTISSPYSFVSVSPDLPITLSPGESATLTVTIKAPSVSGSYAVTGTVSTN